MREEIINHINYLKIRINNRKQILYEDESKYIIIENRILSSNMANIPGINKHLRHTQLAKENNSINEIKDIYSHGSYSKGELQFKYNTPRRYSHIG